MNTSTSQSLCTQMFTIQTGLQRKAEQKPKKKLKCTPQKEFLSLSKIVNTQERKDKEIEIG